MTIASFDPAGRVDQPLTVVARVTSGRAARVRLWLDDDATETTLQVGGGLAYYGPVSLGIVPRVAGHWRLWASATDAAGCTQQTRLDRAVDIVR